MVPYQSGGFDMIPKSRFIAYLCAVVFLTLSSCNPSLVSDYPSLPTSTQTSFNMVTKVPTTIPATATVTPDMKSMVLTPDDIFSILAPQIVDTPSAKDFCEHVPQPKLDDRSSEFVVLAGVFSFCDSRNWDTAFDLDTGTLVTSNDKNADILLLRDKAALASEPFYYLYSVNGALVDGVDSNAITYQSCENMKLSTVPPQIFFVNNEGAIACVLTTNDQVALIRTEHIYPLDTDSVEFSFVVLKKE